MAHFDDFDVDRSVAQAWTEFQARLSEVVSMIDESADLTIGIESESSEAAPFVRFSAPSRDLVRTEAASNNVLGPAFQLSADGIAGRRTCAALGIDIPVGPLTTNADVRKKS